MALARASQKDSTRHSQYQSMTTTHCRQLSSKYQSQELMKKPDIADIAFQPRTANPGFPPDLLHDLLEGVVPVELALCLQGMISVKHFTLNDLNQAIKTFPYQHNDKVDRPHPVTASFSSRGTIGGNGHENHALLRLLPVIIGSKIPDGDRFWEILMALKDVVDLAMCHKFTEETLQYMSCKISEHRQILQEVFPNLMLRPKHHFLEHYPHLIRCFGPLVHLWTMRFEGKHRIFKRIIHEANNFKNVLKTCAERHQLMMTYHLSSPKFFKPPIEMSQVKSAFIDTLPPEVQASVSQTVDDLTVLSTNRVNIDGTSFAVGMFVCTGVQNSLPEFKEITNILLLANEITVVLKDYDAWYVEHLRSFELTVTDGNSHVVRYVPHSQIKRPRRGEINYIPNYPAGESKDSLEAQRNELHSEFQKAPAERDGPLIFLLMQRTFALRREEIINSPRPIAELRERWPALFCEAQLYKEVHRITNQNLPFNFFAALDKYTPQLLNLYKEKQTGTLGKKMAALLSDYSKQDNDIQATRTAVLFGLALYLKEDASEIFKSCKEVDFEESQTGAVTLLALTEDNPSAVPFNPQHVTVILEDQTRSAIFKRLQCVHG
ncbi:uncharacterized protein LOC134445957 [Engraulis encrasicolus]|uniref:uncharacterized protein LOC134445957 n=1 Tax=Engraulis encrasicolus TaxID=184585 RepID=UPI002FD466BA